MTARTIDAAVAAPALTQIRAQLNLLAGFYSGTPGPLMPALEVIHRELTELERLLPAPDPTLTASPDEQPARDPGAVLMTAGRVLAGTPAPDPDGLDADEWELVVMYRLMTDEQQDNLLHIASFAAENPRKPSGSGIQ